MLKKFSAAGVTLHEIAKFMYRDDPEVPSALEGIIKKTEEFVETMRSELVNDILIRLAQSTPKKGNKIPSPSPIKKGNNQIFLQDFFKRKLFEILNFRHRKKNWTFKALVELS